MLACRAVVHGPGDDSGRIGAVIGRIIVARAERDAVEHARVVGDRVGAGQRQCLGGAVVARRDAGAGGAGREQVAGRLTGRREGAVRDIGARERHGRAYEDSAARIGERDRGRQRGRRTCFRVGRGRGRRDHRGRVHHGERHVVAAAGDIVDLIVDAALRERRALRQARKGAADGAAAVVLDDGEDLADARREAVDQREVERGAAERDGAAGLHDGLVVAAGAAGAGARAADLLIEIRSGVQRQARDRHGARVARRKAAAGIDRHGARAAVAAECGAGHDLDRRRCDLTVDNERSGLDGRRARIGVVPAENERAGAVDHDADAALGVGTHDFVDRKKLVHPGYPGVSGRGRGACIVADHAG